MYSAFERPLRLKRVAKFRRSVSLHSKYLRADEMYYQASNENIWPASESGSEKDLPLRSEAPSSDHVQNYALGPFSQPQKISNSILLPTFLVLGPILLFSVALLGLVFGRRVRKIENTFSTIPSYDDDWAYILVDYPATRITFLASWLSTITPILSSAVMGIWSLFAAQSHLRYSAASRRDEMFTAPSISLETGLLLASFTSLRKYYTSLLAQRRRSSSNDLKQRSHMPHIVHRTAMMMSLCALVVLTILVSETYLDIFTQTVPFEKVSVLETANSTYGRSVSKYCLDFDRTANYGLPCSRVVFINQSEPLRIESQADLNEWYLLQHNTSQTSEIQFTSSSGSDSRDLAILLPQLIRTPSNVDYRATTIGVSTRCRPISTDCRMRIVDDDPYHTGFNCSDNFWGVLGKAPNITELSISYNKAYDPDLPVMSFKPTPNLQYGFFTDEALTIPYNSVGYDSKTGGLTGDAATDHLPDDDLINPVYMGVAGRFGTLSESVGSNLTYDEGVFHTNLTYVDFVLSCSYLTLEVTYTLINGTVTNVSSVPHKTGVISEIYHGFETPWNSPVDTSFLLQDDVLMAALQNTSAAMAQEWANLHSVKVLSTIGGYTSPKLNLMEQIRTTVLVAQIPAIALATLVAGSLSYAILAAVLAIFAVRIWLKDPEIGPTAAYLTLDGLAAMAFREETTVNAFDYIDKLSAHQSAGEDHV